MIDFFQEFYDGGKLPKAVTTSFLTLIPKKDPPQGMNKFRPIFLVGCLYKIISKLLATMLKKGFRQSGLSESILTRSLILQREEKNDC